MSQEERRCKVCGGKIYAHQRTDGYCSTRCYAAELGIRMDPPPKRKRRRPAKAASRPRMHVNRRISPEGAAAYRRNLEKGRSAWLRSRERAEAARNNLQRANAQVAKDTAAKQHLSLLLQQEALMESLARKGEQL